MSVSVKEQLCDFLCALLLGGIIGIVYDVLRVIRGRGRYSVLTAIFDVIFCIVCGILTLMYGFTVGDLELRIFALFGIICGEIFYFSWFSRGIIFLLSKIGHIFKGLLKPLKDLFFL